MSKKKALYITYDGLTDPLGRSQILPYLVGLSKEYDIHILSAEKPSRYQENRATIESICSNNGLKWHPVEYERKVPVLSPVINYNKLKKKAKQLQNQYQFDICHCRSYIPSLIGLNLKRKHNVRFVFDMRGFWADERIDGNLWNQDKWIYRKVYQFFKKKEKEFIAESDSVISLTQKGKEEMLTWGIEIPAEKITVIPCCADFEHFNYNKIPEEKVEEVKSELKIESDIVFSYLGSLGTWYLLREMMEFFKIALDKLDAHFLIITRDDKEVVYNLADELTIPRSKISITPSSREDVPVYLAVSDINLFFIKPAYSKMSSSPTKMAEVMGIGIPIICNKNVGDLEEIFIQNQIGLAIDVDSDFDQYIPQIESLLSTEKSEIREAGLKEFNLEDGIREYQSIYNRLFH